MVLEMLRLHHLGSRKLSVICATVLNGIRCRVLAHVMIYYVCRKTGLNYVDGKLESMLVLVKYGAIVQTD